MRSITLHTVRRICVYQHAKCGSNHKYGHPCSSCCITEICRMFVDAPINWNEYTLKSIDEDSAAFYKLMKGDQ